MKTRKSNRKRHPQHDQIRASIHCWFRRPIDVAGLRAVVRHWGTYWDHGDVYPTGLLAADLPAFLTDLRRFYKNRELAQVVVDMAEINSALDAAFTNAGWARQIDTLFLAHTGVFPGGRLPDLVMQHVTEEDFNKCTSLPRLAFSELLKEEEAVPSSDSEEQLAATPRQPREFVAGPEPAKGTGDTGKLLRNHFVSGSLSPLSADQQQVANSNSRNRQSPELSCLSHDESVASVQLENEGREVQTRIAGDGKGLLAIADDEVVGMLWAYEKAQDIWVSRLAVREPFPHRTIAHALLKHRVALAYSSGYRSVIVNAQVNNVESLRFYRRLGFSDEVCRQRRYSVELPH